MIEVVDRAEQRKEQIINKFLKKTGVIPRPFCYVCNGGNIPNIHRQFKKKNELKQVKAIKVDYHPFHDDIILRIFCHGEQAVLHIPADKIDYLSKIEIGFAFGPTKSNNEERSLGH